MLGSSARFVLHLAELLICLDSFENILLWYGLCKLQYLLSFDRVLSDWLFVLSEQNVDTCLLYSLLPLRFSINID